MLCSYFKETMSCKFQSAFQRHLFIETFSGTFIQENVTMTNAQSVRNEKLILQCASFTNCDLLSFLTSVFNMSWQNYIHVISWIKQFVMKVALKYLCGFKDWLCSLAVSCCLTVEFGHAFPLSLVRCNTLSQAKLTSGLTAIIGDFVSVFVEV